MNILVEQAMDVDDQSDDEYSELGEKHQDNNKSKGDFIYCRLVILFWGTSISYICFTLTYQVQFPPSSFINNFNTRNCISFTSMSCFRFFLFLY